ncbi:MAG: sigma-70 family RNA polymerase sigma factor [Deltaproteobacteria bacterium]|nr:sigma-70 family RNA polymerase sigma factor [Deltaproteobacteria bacterium]
MLVGTKQNEVKTVKTTKVPTFETPSVPVSTKSKLKREGGRDEVLSDYLASLGGIALFGPDEEKDYAARLLQAEVGAWSHLLGEREVVDFLLENQVMLDDKKFNGESALRTLRECFQKSRTAFRLRGERKISAAKSVEKIALLMRVFDNDRVLIDEALGLLEKPSSHEGGKKALDEQRRRRQVYEDARRERRRALRIRNQFVRANLRLVVSVARRFHHYRMPLIDLIQEGNLGLIKSVHGFDHTKGFRFSTYAHWWIRQAIDRAIMNKGAQVRLPVHIFDARREVAKASHELSQKLLRDPTYVELAEALQMPLEKLTDIVKAVPREPTSLDETMGDDEDRTVAEVISDKLSSPCESVIQRDDEMRARRLLHKLSPMEIDIIERRYGLHQDIDETLEEIGKSYSLSRERVRQIQVQGIKKMQRFHQASAR